MQKPKLRINMYAKILLLCTSSILAALILLAALLAQRLDKRMHL